MSNGENGYKTENSLDFATAGPTYINVKCILKTVINKKRLHSWDQA